MSDRLLLSVIICTYNRADLLDICLTSLSVQTLLDEDWEVIVVDNNSTDHTNEIVNKWKSALNIRYIKEVQQGLSFARNAGLACSSAKFIAYLDDDCACSPGWLAAIIDGYYQFPQTACFGGKIDLRWEGGTRPAWLPEDVMPVLGFQNFGDQIVEIRHINGGNMVWMRSILNALGGFNTKLGRIGDKKFASEESEVQEKAKINGYTIRYLPKAIVYHWVPKHRQSKKHILHLCIMVGKSASISDHMNHKSGSNLYNFLYTSKTLLNNFLPLITYPFKGKVRRKKSSLYYFCILSISFGRWLTDLFYLGKPYEN